MRLNRITLLPFGISGVLYLGCGESQPEQGPSTAALQTSPCAHAAIAVTTQGGSAQSQLATPMTLPVPAIIPVRGGAADAAATLTFTLSADNNRPLACRYQRSGVNLVLVSCEREVDATSWVEASGVALAVSDPNVTAGFSLCPVGPVADPAKLHPPIVEGRLTERLAREGQRIADERVPDGLTSQEVAAYVARARRPACPGAAR